MADYLTRRGIAVLRFDERRVGGSTGDRSRATIEDIALDVLAGIHFLKSHKEFEVSKISLLGHSEGGMIGELAARSVRSAEDGFTARPFPAGKIQSRPDELEDFAGFLRKHAIAYPLADEQELILVVPENFLVYLLGLKKDYRYATHVAIDHDGQMAVRISERDCSRYQQEFTFDRLCAALGNLIVDFLEMYRNGKSSEIIERMDVLKFLV